MKRPCDTPPKSNRAPAPQRAAPLGNRPKAPAAPTSPRSDVVTARPSSEIANGRRRKNGQYPKGKSGNRKGRPRGSKNKKTVIIEMMEAKLGRKIPDPRKLTRYEGMMFKAIQKALGGDIRSMGFVLTEYRKAIESSGSLTAVATTEEDQQAYDALCAKIRREVEEEIRNKNLKETKK